jgi:hypothetical protein
MLINRFRAQPPKHLKEDVANKSVDLNLDAESDLKPLSKGRKIMWMAQSTPAETTAREAADQTLTSNLDTEITRARAAEALNTSDI